MKHFKINVGRKRLSSEYIQSKQNFDSVLKGVKLSQPGIWKSPWFYGVVGLSGVAIAVGYYFNQSQNQINETLITQNKEFDKEVSLDNNYIAMASIAPQGIRIRPEELSKTALPVTEERIVKKEKITREPEVKPVVQDKKTEEREAVVISETETPKRAKPVRSSMPSISGVYNGDISWENFRNGEIFVGDDLKVKQFSIQYTTRLGDKTISVKGEKIPDEVIAELENLGLNQTIFITNVVATEETGGGVMRFVSMDLNLKFR